MTKSLPTLLWATLGAQVSPTSAHEGSVGRASMPVGVQLTPSRDVDTWMLVMSPAEEKLWVANP